jgi:hypothetical protein
MVQQCTIPLRVGAVGGVGTGQVRVLWGPRLPEFRKGQDKETVEGHAVAFQIRKQMNN